MTPKKGTTQKTVKTKNVAKSQKKTAVVEAKSEALVSSLKFLSAVGKRKTAVAHIKLFPKGEGKFEINGKQMEFFFPTATLQKIITTPLDLAGIKKNIDIFARIKGGGIRGQAEGLRLAVSRALIKLNPNLRPAFRRIGFLTRDSRIKERKKYGLKRARRAPQWQKR